MLTEKDIKDKYGDDIIFLFKPHLEENGETVFTQAENGKPMGTLIERDEKVQCYECGKWMKAISGAHLKSHNFDKDSYKEKYGFSKKAGLCSKEYSEKRSKIATTIIGSGKGLGRVGKQFVSGKSRKSNLGCKRSIQKKNNKNTCPAQYEKRFLLLQQYLGDNFGFEKARSIDYGAVAWAIRKYGSFNNAKKHFNLPAEHRTSRKNDAQLVYDLRDYVKKYQSLPWNMHKNNLNEEIKIGAILNNFPHSLYPYISRWGSITKFREHCGIKYIGKQRWEVID